MGEDRSVPVVVIILYGLWAWVGCTIVAGWALMWADVPYMAQMLGFTACASSAVAAVAHVRCYFLRVCRLIRVTHGVDEGAPAPTGADLHRIR